MLEKLDEIAWTDLTHAYGQAGDVPAMIRALASLDPEDWVGAMDSLYVTLCHQGSTVYEATAAAVPFLIELLDNRDVPCRGAILRFLGDAARATSYLAVHPPLSTSDIQPDTEQFRRQLERELTWVRHTREAIWSGLDVYLRLVADFDKRLRIAAPYTLGLLSSRANAEMPESIRPRNPIQLAADAMVGQFEEEPNELVRASLVFGIASLARSFSDAASFLERATVDPNAGRAVQVSAALCLADVVRRLPSAALEILVEALRNCAQTDHLFDSDQPAMESKHHPLAKAYREVGLPLDEESGTGFDAEDVGGDEGFAFPWFDDWPTLRILRRLSARSGEHLDRIMPVALSYLDQASSHTVADIARPILGMVFGENRITGGTSRADLTETQAEVLTRLYDNPVLWASSLANIPMVLWEFGLSDNRDDWRRLLGIQQRQLGDDDIEAMLRRLAADQQSGDPRRIRDLQLGQAATGDFLRHVKTYSELESLDLSGVELKDEDLAHLADLRELTRLDIPSSQVTDAGVRHLEGLTNLESLCLARSSVTDRGLEHLKGLANLQNLDLSSTQITDVGVGHLSRLTKLRSLYLGHTQVTDLGLVHLKSLSGLRWLNLAGTQVTGTGLVHLKKLRNLNELNLTNTHLTDAGLVHLRRLTNLERLHLSNTRLTDTGLPHLKKLTKLRYLILTDTQVSERAVPRLQKALPNCRIFHGPGRGRARPD